MNFNKHYNLQGKHAFLSASKWHWLNYDPERLRRAWANARAAEIGTRKHALAKELIELGVKLPRNKNTLNQYVNDGIAFRMTCEQVLYYSPNCFGTADTISFDGKLLRIHDLKTGDIPAHPEQLMIYAAMFCYEYGIEPEDISFELRIYQSCEVKTYTPSGEEIRAVMTCMEESDRLISEWSKEEA